VGSLRRAARTAGSIPEGMIRPPPTSLNARGKSASPGRRSTPIRRTLRRADVRAGTTVTPTPRPSGAPEGNKEKWACRTSWATSGSGSPTITPSNDKRAGASTTTRDPGRVRRPARTASFAAELERRYAFLGPAVVPFPIRDRSVNGRFRLPLRKRS
jgi:hypothetical protein